MGRFVKPVLGICAATVLLSLGAGALLWAAPVVPGALPAAGATAEVWRWGLASAAVATGLSAVAGAFAVARVGVAAVGALAEKPELFGRLLILVGVAEGIAIYGVIIAVLILNRLS